MSNVAAGSVSGRKRIGVIGVVAACAAFTVALAAGVAQQPQDNPRPRPNMRAADRAFKQLQTLVADAAKKQEALDLLQQMQVELLQAKAKRPPRTDKTDAGLQAKFLSDYRMMTADLLALTLDAEKALLSDKPADAAKAVDAMLALKEDGHKKFR